jgi:hypothetical protein
MDWPAHQKLEVRREDCLGPKVQVFPQTRERYGPVHYLWDSLRVVPPAKT